MTADAQLTLWRRQCDRLSAARHAAEKRKESARARLSSAQTVLDDREAARKILQGVAANLQQQAQRAVSGVVTAALSAVFGPDAYGFLISLEERRGKTEADLFLTRDGANYSPLESAGGGVCDVVVFSLRLAALVLSRPAMRRLLCLDEPFRHLSRDYAGRVAGLLERLCEELDLQIVMTTHSPALACGHVVELG